MSQTDGGPATNNGVLDCPVAYGSLAGPGNSGVEFHAPLGANPLSPGTGAQIIDASGAGTNYAGNAVTPVNSSGIYGIIVNPA